LQDLVFVIHNILVVIVQYLNAQTLAQDKDLVLILLVFVIVGGLVKIVQ